MVSFGQYIFDRDIDTLMENTCMNNRDFASHETGSSLSAEGHRRLLSSEITLTLGRS